jgi:hypothetical protein
MGTILNVARSAFRLTPEPGRLLMYKRALLLGIVTAVSIAACSDDDDPITPVSKIVNFSATLTGAQENPAVTTAGTGTFTATLDTSTNVFTYNVTYTGLNANVNNGHIHGPAPVGTNTGVILNFATLPGATFVQGATAGTATGTVVLNATTQISTTVNGDSLRKLLFAGQTYANIHTTAHQGGEIRGQITKNP